MTRTHRLIAALIAAATLLLAPVGVAPAAHAAAGNWTFTDSGRTNILNSATKLTTDTLKVQLYTSATNLGASSTSCSTVTNEVSSTNTGYTTGGATITLTLAGTTSVTASFTSNPTWTAGSANLTANKAGLCDTTADKVVAFFSLDSGNADVTVTTGNTLTIDSDGSPSPVFTFS